MQAGFEPYDGMVGIRRSLGYEQRNLYAMRMLSAVHTIVMWPEQASKSQANKLMIGYNTDS